MAKVYKMQHTPLAQKLRARRVELGLTQIEAAGRCGTEQATYSRWENRGKPDPVFLDAVAVFLGYDGAEDPEFSQLYIRTLLALET